MARSGRNASGRAAASSRRMVTASSIAASASSRRPRSASRTDRLFSDPARRPAASGSPSTCAARYWVTCWLVRVAASAASCTLCSGIWSASGAARPGWGASCSARLARSASSAVPGGDRQVDDPGKRRGEQLVESRPDGGLVRGAAGQLGEQLGEQPGFPALPGGEPGGGGGEGGQLRGVGQVLLGEQVRPQRVPVAGPGIQPVRPHHQRLGPDPGDFGLVRQRRQQRRGARLVAGRGQRGQRDHLVDQGQVRVEGQMRSPSWYQRVRSRSHSACSSACRTGRPGWPAVLSLPAARSSPGPGGWGRGCVHRAQQRGDVDEQRFRVRRIIQLGRRRHVGRRRPGAAVGGERGARAAEVLGPVGGRDGMAVQVQDRVGVGQLLLADQPVPPGSRGPRQQQQPDLAARRRPTAGSRPGRRSGRCAGRRRRPPAASAAAAGSWRRRPGAGHRRARRPTRPPASARTLPGPAGSCPTRRRRSPAAPACRPGPGTSR